MRPNYWQSPHNFQTILFLIGALVMGFLIAGFTLLLSFSMRNGKNFQGELRIFILSIVSYAVVTLLLCKSQRKYLLKVVPMWLLIALIGSALFPILDMTFQVLVLGSRYYISGGSISDILLNRGEEIFSIFAICFIPSTPLYGALALANKLLAKYSKT